MDTPPSNLQKQWVRRDAQDPVREGNVSELVAVELFRDELSRVGKDNIYEVLRQSIFAGSASANASHQPHETTRWQGLNVR